MCLAKPAWKEVAYTIWALLCQEMSNNTHCDSTWFIFGQEESTEATFGWSLILQSHTFCFREVHQSTVSQQMVATKVSKNQNQSFLNEYVTILLKETSGVPLRWSCCCYCGRGTIFCRLKKGVGLSVDSTQLRSTVGCLHTNEWWYQLNIAVLESKTVAEAFQVIQQATVGNCCYL